MTTEATPGALGSNEQLGLVERLRQRGNDLRSHPVANSTVDRVEEVGELLHEAAAELQSLRAALLDANQICRSAWQIANRIATEYSTNEFGTYFGAFSERTHESLMRQHETILATGGYLGPNVRGNQEPT